MKRSNKFYLIFAALLAVIFVLGVFAPAAAEASTAKERALEEVREAIRALPPASQITEADRPAVEEARRLMSKAMSDYGATEYDVCVLSAKLAAAGARLGGVSLPPTGGVSPVIPLGLLSMVAGAVLLIPRKRH